MAVPFIFIVMPSGRVNDDISSLIPSSSTEVFWFRDSAAADDAAENPSNATLDIFLINIKGFKPVFTYMNNGYPISKNKMDAIATTSIYDNAELKWSKPYTAKVLDIRTKTAIGLNLVIIKFKKTVIMLLISSSSFFKTNILSPKQFMQSPVQIAKTTTAKTLELVENIAVILLGTASISTRSGLDELAVWADATFPPIFTVNNPKVFAM